MRVAVRELMQRELTDDERRHPYEILTDAVHRLDAVMRHGAFDTDAAYVEHVALVVRMVKLLLESKAIETRTLAYANIDAAGRAAVDALEAALDALDLPPERRALAWSVLHRFLVERTGRASTQHAVEPGVAAVLEAEALSTVDARDDGDDDE